MIYIHIPFCHRKCTYCAFYSMGTQDEALRRSYIDALITEMHMRRGELGQPPRTVYLGGGTPSMLGVEGLRRIVVALRECFDTRMVEEATVECNPEDIDAGFMAGLASLGFFNRVSIGVQSLNDDTLRLLGRRHTAAQAADAVRVATQAGFSNISVDFMYGLPGGRMKLPDPAMLYAVKHVSAYALTVEPRTALAVQVERGTVILPSDDEVAVQYHAMRQCLKDAGFEQYEVSNFCRNGFQSLHNSRYWTRTPYLGLGAAAHSFSGDKRRWNVSNVKRYIDCVSNRMPFYEEELLTDNDAFNETLMTALRTARGLPADAIPYKRRAMVNKKMASYIACGWITVNGGHYSPTAEGLLHADGMAADLFV